VIEIEKEMFLQALHDENERLGLYEDAYEDPENTLHWHALNYRTASTQNAQEMFEKLEKFVEIKVAQAVLKVLM